MPSSPLTVSGPMGRSYTLHGLKVYSEVPLPLVEAPGDAVATHDVRIRLCAPAELPRRAVRGCYGATPEEAHLHYPGIGEIHVRDGAEIEVLPAPGVHHPLLSQFIIGVAFGILLHQRGHLTLHASAVALGGGVVAFVGWKGMGKSTTAAAFHAAGHPLVAEDTVACDRSDVVTVLPGVRQFKLDPAAAAYALRVDPASLPRLHEAHERRIHLVDDDYRPQPRPLRGVFVLEWGETVGLESLKPEQAFVELVRHAYALRFLGPRGGVSRHFEQATELARTVPVVRLVRPRSLEALPAVIDAVRAWRGEAPKGEPPVPVRSSPQAA